MSDARERAVERLAAILSAIGEGGRRAGDRGGDFAPSALVLEATEIKHEQYRQRAAETMASLHLVAVPAELTGLAARTSAAQREAQAAWDAARAERVAKMPHHRAMDLQDDADDKACAASDLESEWSRAWTDFGDAVLAQLTEGT